MKEGTAAYRLGVGIGNFFYFLIRQGEIYDVWVVISNQIQTVFIACLKQIIITIYKL